MMKIDRSIYAAEEAIRDPVVQIMDEHYRLADAAPKLLEACKLAMDLLRESLHYSDNIEAHNKVIEKVKQAIILAEGRKS